MSILAAKKKLLMAQESGLMYVGSSANPNSSGVAIPANNGGDLLIAVVGSVNSALPTITQSGWTILERSQLDLGGGSVREATIAFKFAPPGGEVGSVNWTPSGTSFSACVHVFRGAAGVGNISTRNGGASDTGNTGHLPALTLQQPGKSLVFGCNYGVAMTANPSGMFRLTGNFAALTTTPPPGNFPITSYSKSGSYDITISAEILSQ